MDLDRFSKIIDDFLTENEINLLITLPEGTEKATIKDNVGGGPTINFFIQMRGLITTFQQFREIVGDEEGFFDELLKMVKREVMEGCDDE